MELVSYIVWARQLLLEHIAVSRYFVYHEPKLVTNFEKLIRTNLSSINLMSGALVLQLKLQLSFCHKSQWDKVLISLELNKLPNVI